MKAAQPGGPSREDILQRRAERLAAVRHDDAPRRIVARVALVGVGTQRFGIPIDDVREIVPLPDITSLPGLPPWFLGIAQLRGEILGVVDLASVLEAGREHARAMAVVEGAGGLFGLAVESVLGFREIYEDEMSDELGSDPERPFQAITRDLVVLIDVKRLPAAPDEAGPAGER